MAGPERFHVLTELRPWLLSRAQVLSYDRRQDAEDLVQQVLESFINAFREKPLPSEPARCMAWLATALRNEFISRLRKQRVRDHVHLQSDDVEEVAVEWTPPPDSFDRPKYETVTDEELEQAMGLLTPKQQQALEQLSTGKPYRDIAKDLGTKEGTIAKRVFDARQRLREALLRGRRTRPSPHALRT